MMFLQRKNMDKFFDNSREGNDYYIIEEWIWIDRWKVATRKSGILGGYGYRIYKNPHNNMPEEVRNWFICK
jgi:hypothetical protein